MLNTYHSRRPFKTLENLIICFRIYKSQKEWKVIQSSNIWHFYIYFQHWNDMQLIKEEIETFNKDLKLICLFT